MVDMNLAEILVWLSFLLIQQNLHIVFTFITLLSSFSERQLKNVDGRRKSM